MIPIAIKLFLGGVFKRLSGLFGLMRDYPRETIIIALLAISALLWWGNQNAQTQRDAAIAGWAQAVADGEQSLAAQIKLTNETKAAYAAAAKDADNEYTKDLAAANGAADRYAAANRVRGKACVGRASETSSPAEDNHSAFPEVPPAEALVAITRADFDKCTALYPYANGAYQWGVTLREVGLAE